MVQHLLDLIGVAGGDVGDGPGSLLLNVYLVVLEQVVEGWESPVVQNALRLAVVACDDVSDRPQGWGYHRYLIAVQEFYKSGHNI